MSDHETRGDLEALARVGLWTRPTRLQLPYRSALSKRSSSPTSITTTSSPPTTPSPRCLRTRCFKPPPKPTLFSWIPRLPRGSANSHLRRTVTAHITSSLKTCRLGWPYCCHPYCTESLSTTSHLFIALDCPSPALTPTSAADIQSPASSLQLAHLSLSAASSFPPIALYTSPADQRSSSLHHPISFPTFPTTTRPLTPTNNPSACPTKEDDTSTPPSSFPVQIARRFEGPNAPQFLPSHLPKTTEAYSNWIDSLSDNYAVCLATGQADALWGTGSDICSHEHDSINQWESCSDNSSDCGTTPTSSSVESPLLAIHSTSCLPSATTSDSTRRLFLPYPFSSLPCTIATWWQNHQYIIVDSIFFHGYKCHPLDIEHWLGLSVNSCEGPFDSTYLQLCEERVSELCDYFFCDDFRIVNGHEVPSLGCVYSEYLITLLNALGCHLLCMHKLRLACWPSPRYFSSADDAHSSPYCLSFTTPHILPQTYTTMFDHCKEYNDEWHRTHYGQDWYETSTLHSIISSPATTALIVHQIQLFGYVSPFLDRSLLSPSATLLQEAPPQDTSYYSDNQSTTSSCSYPSASKSSTSPGTNNSRTGPTGHIPRNQSGFDDLSVLSDTSADDWGSRMKHMQYPSLSCRIFTSTLNTTPLPFIPTPCNTGYVMFLPPLTRLDTCCAARILGPSVVRVLGGLSECILHFNGDGHKASSAWKVHSYTLPHPSTQAHVHAEFMNALQGAICSFYNGRNGPPFLSTVLPSTGGTNPPPLLLSCSSIASGDDSPVSSPVQSFDAYLASTRSYNRSRERLLYARMHSLSCHNRLLRKLTEYGSLWQYKYIDPPRYLHSTNMRPLTSAAEYTQARWRNSHLTHNPYISPSTNRTNNNTYSNNNNNNNNNNNTTDISNNVTSTISTHNSIKYNNKLSCLTKVIHFRSSQMQAGVPSLEFSLTPPSHCRPYMTRRVLIPRTMPPPERNLSSPPYSPPFPYTQRRFFYSLLPVIYMLILATTTFYRCYTSLSQLTPPTLHNVTAFRFQHSLPLPSSPMATNHIESSPSLSDPSLAFTLTAQCYCFPPPFLPMVTNHSESSPSLSDPSLTFTLTAQCCCLPLPTLTSFQHRGLLDEHSVRHTHITLFSEACSTHVGCLFAPLLLFLFEYHYYYPP